MNSKLVIEDIRSGRLEAGTELPLYQLPASAFVYAYQGHARVQMDDLQVTLRQNQIIHGGRG